MATFSENALVDMIDFYKDHDWNDIEVVREAVIQWTRLETCEFRKGLLTQKWLPALTECRFVLEGVAMLQWPQEQVVVQAKPQVTVTSFQETFHYWFDLGRDFAGGMRLMREMQAALREMQRWLQRTCCGELHASINELEKIFADGVLLLTAQLAVETASQSQLTN